MTESHSPPAAGSPWHIARMLQHRSGQPPIRVDEIREVSQGHMPDGHLSEGTILRAIGVLAFCRLAAKVKGDDGVYRYHLVQLSEPEWQACERLLLRLGDRPSVVLKTAIRLEMLAALPRLIEQDALSLREEAVGVRHSLHAVPLPALSFFHCALLAKRLLDKGQRVEIAQVNGFVHYFVECTGHLIDPFPEGYRTRALNLGVDLSPFLADEVLTMPRSAGQSGIYTDDLIPLRDEALSWAIQEIRKETKFIKQDMPPPDPALRSTFAPLVGFLRELFTPVGGTPLRLVTVSGDFDVIENELTQALSQLPEQEMIILDLIVNYRDGQDYRMLVDEAGAMQERLRQIRSGDFDAEREEYEFLFDFTVFSKHRTIQLSNLSIGKPADSEHYQRLRGKKIGSTFFKTWARILSQRYPGWQVTCLAIEELKDSPFRIIPHLMQSCFAAYKPENPYRVDFIGEVNRAFIVDPKYAGTFYVGKIPDSTSRPSSKGSSRRLAIPRAPESTG